MDLIRFGRRHLGALRRRLFALGHAFHQRGVPVVQRLREPIGDVIRQIGARQDEAPRADRIHRLLLAFVRARGHRDGLEEVVLGVDLRDFVRRETDEAAAGLHDRSEARPADATAPESCDAAVGHHHRAVAGLFEIVRDEVLLAVEAETVGDVAAEQRQAGGLRAPGDRLANEIAQRLRRAVAAHGEHAGVGVDRRDDLEVGRRAADAGEGLVGRFARDQRDVHLALFEQSDVLGRALGVLGLHVERRVGLVDDGRGVVAEEREAAAGRGGGHGDGGLLC